MTNATNATNAVNAITNNQKESHMNTQTANCEESSMSTSNRIAKPILTQAVNAAAPQNNSLKWFVPIATGAMGTREYIEWLSRETAVTQDGRSYSALYAAGSSAPYAVSAVTKTLWGAQQAGALGYTRSLGAARQFQKLVESISHSLAAQLNRSVVEVPAALVKIRTLHNMDADESASTSFKDQVEEAIEHYRQQLVAGQISQSDFRLVRKELLNQLKEHELNVFLRQELQDQLTYDDGRPANTEGGIEAAIHEPKDLWGYEPKAVVGAEGYMISGLHAFKGVDLPIDDPEWSHLTARVAESLAVAIEYASPEEKADIEAKAEVRMAVAEGGLMANPWKARWAVNYLARRIWRDREVLRATKARYERSNEQIEEDMFREERSGTDKPRLTRVITEHPRERDSEPRSYYLVWDVIAEHELWPETLTYRDRFGNVCNMTQGEFYIERNKALIDECDRLLGVMDRLYDKVVGVEDHLRVVWSLMARDPMPSQPPVYWNHKGFYLTEDAAKDALAVERAEAGETRREAVVEGTHTHLELLLKAQGLM